MAAVGEIRVLVLEQREVVRLGLEAMLDAIPEVSRRDGAAEGVDVVISSPELSAAAPPSARRLVLVTAWSGADIEAAVAARPDGYVAVRELTSSSLRTALHQVTVGDVPLPEQVASYLLAVARRDVRMAPTARLTPREDDVLELLVAGHSNQEIATSLGISIHGAKRHVSSILNKFESPSRAHLVSRVLQARSPGAPPVRRGG
ncbi:MAG TPA: response regulator transcription factor [Acidimicrobiales bacterium]|nr:response regulator transcription factor [Acidimicrobiales bacterium]